MNLSVRAVERSTCEVYWDLTKVTREQLLDRAVDRISRRRSATSAAVQNITEDNMPEAHIRGDINTPYRCIGGAIFTMQRAGFARIGFISAAAAARRQRL